MSTGKNKGRSQPISLASEALIGRTPPQALEIEEVVLGAILLERGAFDRVADKLRPETFYHDAHRHVFEACVNLAKEGEPIDLMTVTNKLRSSDKLEEVGGAYFITKLTNRVASSANIEFHSRILQERFVMREIIRTSAEVSTKAFVEDNDALELLSDTMTAYSNIQEGLQSKQEVTLLEASNMAIKEAEARAKSGVGMSGYPTRFDEFNRLTGGLGGGELMILAARPAMGKSAMAINLALDMADQGLPVAIFSLEMPAIQIAQRLQANISGVYMHKIRNGELNEMDWEQLMRADMDLPIFIEDQANMSIMDLRAKCHRLVRDKGVKVLIVDYLQLIKGNRARNGNREQEISSISRALKIIAKELNVPVVALSQLSRAVEMRSDKRPQLSDLRESGSLEQDADVVTFMYWNHYYNPNQPSEYAEVTGMDPEKHVELIVGKCRNGSTGVQNMSYEASEIKYKSL